MANRLSSVYGDSRVTDRQDRRDRIVARPYTLEGKITRYDRDGNALEFDFSQRDINHLAVEAGYKGPMKYASSYLQGYRNANGDIVVDPSKGGAVQKDPRVFAVLEKYGLGQASRVFFNESQKLKDTDPQVNAQLEQWADNNRAGFTLTPMMIAGVAGGIAGLQGAGILGAGGEAAGTYGGLTGADFGSVGSGLDLGSAGAGAGTSGGSGVLSGGDGGFVGGGSGGTTTGVGSGSGVLGGGGSGAVTVGGVGGVLSGAGDVAIGAGGAGTLVDAAGNVISSGDGGTTTAGGDSGGGGGGGGGGDSGGGGGGGDISVDTSAWPQWLTDAWKASGLSAKDFISGALQGGLGLYGADKMADAYSKAAADALAQSDKWATTYFNVGDPYRKQLEASYGQGFNLWDQPGYGDAFNQAADTATRSWSAQGGNPANNPGIQGNILNSVWNSSYLPALSNYRGQLGQFGGLGLNQSGALASQGLQNANNANMASINADGQGYNAIGYGLGTMFGNNDPFRNLALTIGGRRV